MAQKNARSKLYTGLDATRRKALKTKLDVEHVPTVDRCRLVEIQPMGRQLQHAYLKLWFKDARWTYNRGLDYIVL